MFKFLFVGLVACLLGIALQAFAPSKSPEAVSETPDKIVETGFGKAEYFWAVGGYVRSIYKQDTITNTEADTIGLVSRTSTTTANSSSAYTPLISLYSTDISIKRTNSTGTTNVKMYLDKSSTTTPTATGWLTIDSTSTTGVGAGQISRSEMLGEIYRLRVVGTGTQSTIYKIDGLSKKEN